VASRHGVRIAPAVLAASWPCPRRSARERAACLDSVYGEGETRTPRVEHDPIDGDWNASTGSAPTNPFSDEYPTIPTR
jgi:hypothetical protein